MTEEKNKPLNIKIADVASYGKEGVNFDVSNDITVIYGSNGSGKSTFAECLYKHNSPDDDSSKCVIPEDIKDKKFFVFNRSFVRDNFINTQSQPEIFSMGKTNIDIVKDIENKSKELKALNDKMDSKKTKKTVEKGKLKELLEANIDTIWKACMVPYKSKDLKIKKCFSGFLNNGELFFEKILSVYNPKILDEENISIDKLKKEADLLYSDELTVATPLIPSIKSITINKDIKNILKSPLELVGEGINKIIKEAKIDSWFKEGLNHFKTLRENQCPFCQQDVSIDIKDKLKLVFSKDYNEKIQTLKDEKVKYEDLLSGDLKTFKTDSIKSISNDIYVNINSEIGTLKENLQNVIGDMQSKINEPDKNIEFDDDKISFVRLNEYIDEVNDIIKKNNMKISDIKKSKKDLEANVFRFFSIDKRDIFKKYITEQEAIEDTIEDLKDSIFGFYEDINKKTEEIQVLEGKISNSKDTMDNINKTLKSLGMTDFELVSRDNKYTISRQSGSQQDPIFETLSEGEKNIITFIYFIYHAIGKHDSKLEDRIIVIDDPISSLSFDYVFEVAQMIKANFVKDKKLICSKLIILSHHLYFITELVLHTKIDKKKLACYRLSKSNNCTNSLAIIKNKEIGSEYDMLWKVLYKCKNDKGVIIENVLVANVMRQILERFISFTYCHTKRINEFFKKTTKENEYFVRWINRESHFDFINSEGVFTDKDKWFKCFEEFFYNNKHKDHYDKYMNKKDES